MLDLYWTHCVPEVGEVKLLAVWFIGLPICGVKRKTIYLRRSRYLKIDVQVVYVSQLFTKYKHGTDLQTYF